MILKLNTTLKGKHNGQPVIWREGSIFDDKIEKIPKDILDELKADTGIVMNITPKSKPKPKAVGEESTSPTAIVVSNKEKESKPKKTSVKKKPGKLKKKIQ